jgi:hypothetical protein
MTVGLVPRLTHNPSPRGRKTQISKRSGLGLRFAPIDSLIHRFNIANRKPDTQSVLLKIGATESLTAAQGECKLPLRY